MQQQRFLGRAIEAGLTALLPFEAPEHELDLRRVKGGADPSRR